MTTLAYRCTLLNIEDCDNYQENVVEPKTRRIMANKKDEIGVAVRGHRINVDRFRIELDDKTLLKLVKEFIPENAEDVKIFVEVPGGGDWPNCDLDIGDRQPLVIMWTTCFEEDLDGK